MKNTDQRKIKLAIVESNFAIGGVQKLVLDQVRILDREKFDIHLVILTQPDRADFYSLLPNDIALTKLNFSSLYDVRSLFRLIKVLRKISPDVVKSSMYFSNTLVGIIKPLVGYKIIAAEHNTNDNKTFLQRNFNKFLLKFRYTTVVDSNMVADLLSKKDNISRDKFTVIHNGVDIDAVKESENKYLPQRETLREEYGIKADETVFLTIGRVVKQKNHLRMVEAFSTLIKSIPESKLIIIGDGGMKESVENKVIELGIEDKVILLDSRKDIHKFYAMSDITLLSSDHEGFCIAAMEGLAFGAPLVSTKVAGVVEYLEEGKNGFFADKTPESLAEKMQTMISLPETEFKNFQAAARETALNYSVEKYGDKLSNLIYESTYKK